MIGKLSVGRRVFVLALLLVALHRIQLILIVMGSEQVLDSLAKMDAITIAIVGTLLLNLLAILLAVYGRTLGLFLGYLVLVINLVFSGPFLIVDLADLRRLGVWIWSLIILSGNVLGLLFGVVALMERLGNDLPVWTQEMQSRVLKGSGAAIAGMLLLGIVLSVGSIPMTGLPETPDRVIEMELQDMRFRPDQLALVKEQRTALFLINRDEYQHSLDIDTLDIHVTVPAQSSAIVFIEPAENGQFRFYCGVPGHEVAGMSGTLTVRYVRP